MSDRGSVNCLDSGPRHRDKDSVSGKGADGAPQQTWPLLNSPRGIVSVPYRHRGGRIQKINAWYLNTHMVYL